MSCSVTMTPKILSGTHVMSYSGSGILGSYQMGDLQSHGTPTAGHSFLVTPLFMRPGHLCSGPTRATQ